MAASAVFGSGSLLLLGLFLFLGSFELVSLALSTPVALTLDSALSLLFFLQHSGMLRRSFRQRLVRLAPEHTHAAIYSASSGTTLLVLLLFWQRTSIVLLSLTGPARWIVHLLFVFASLSFGFAVRALRAFDPLGLRPLMARLRGKRSRGLPLTIRGPYRWVRHPLYSLSLVLVWACPTFTLDRLLFSLLWTAWILVGAVLEERDLVSEFGQAYRDYQRRVPMLIPWHTPTDDNAPQAGVWTRGE